MRYSNLLKGEVNQERLKVHLKQVLGAKTITEFTVYPSELNTTLGYTADGNKYIIKLMTAPLIAECEKHRFSKVATLLKHIANNPLIPTPQVVHLEEDEKVVGYRYIILTFVEGEKLWAIRSKLTMEDKNSIIKQIATIVRELHTIEYPFYGELEEYDSSVRFSNYKEKMMTQLNSYVEVLFKNEIFPKDLVEKLKDTFISEFESMTFPVKAVLVHKNIQEGNLLLKQNAHGIYQIQALLDWEEACSDNPLEDIIYIQDGMLFNEEHKKIFFDEYFQGRFKNLLSFQIDLKLLHIHWYLSDIVKKLSVDDFGSAEISNAQADLLQLLETKK